MYSLYYLYLYYEQVSDIKFYITLIGRCMKPKINYNGHDFLHIGFCSPLFKIEFPIKLYSFRSVITLY